MTCMPDYPSRQTEKNMRKIECPITVEAQDSMGGTRTTHPAFGQIRASRVSGQANLYGSDFSHQHYLTITVTRSELHRSLSSDWCFAKEELIEVALSESQWATFVSSLNVGGGVPCTIEHIDRITLPGLPSPKPMVDEFNLEIRKTMAELQQQCSDLVQEIGEAGIGKRKTESLQKSLDMLRARLVDSTAFVADQFEEHTERVIEKAKVEVNAYVNAHVTRAGLDALAGGKPVITLLAE